MLSTLASCQRLVPVRRVLAVGFKSRAHPQPVPEFPVNSAVQSVLEDIDRRKRHRDRKWKRNGIDNKEQPDESIELALNLNLDPRRPGQALRGSISLPNGTGRKNVECIVFTADKELEDAALKAGATYAGGEDLVDRIVAGEVPVESMQTSLATSDIMPVLSKKIARILGPRGLMPNAKVGTLLTNKEDLLAALDTQLAGKEVTYRTEKEGIVHVPVGKGSFGTDKILENIGEVMKMIFEVKPENFGKKKKKGKGTGKGTKYLLRASLSSTQGKGIRLDPRTVDPSSLFFLSSVEAQEEAESENEAMAS